MFQRITTCIKDRLLHTVWFNHDLKQRDLDANNVPCLRTMKASNKVTSQEALLPLSVLNVEGVYALLNHALIDDDERTELACIERLHLIRKERKLSNFGILVDFKHSENGRYLEIINDQGEVRQTRDFSFLETLIQVKKLSEDGNIAMVVETGAHGHWKNSQWFDTIAITLV